MSFTPSSALLAILAIAAILTNGQAQNQEVEGVAIVHPGDPIIDGTRIGPYTNVWRYYTVDAQGNEIPTGRWEDVVTVVERDGREVLRRVQRAVQESGNVTRFVDEVDRRTLAPILSQVGPEGGALRWDLTFDGNSVRGKRLVQVRNSGPAPRLAANMDLTLDQPVFNWNLWGVLVAGFQLHEGYSAQYLCYSMSPGIESPLIWVTMEVTGKETIDAGERGEVECWVVDVQSGQPWRLWIATDPSVAPVVKIRIDVPSTGAVRWWVPL